VSGQISNSTESPENVYVKLTFKIPTSVGQSGRTIIKLERGDGSPSQDVLFINNLDFSTRVQEAYTNRLTVTTLASERIVEISILGVQSRDAGMYTCWQDSAFNSLSSLTNCGHKLTIV
ncbi:neural cell adhesion molecule 1, partial [Biomphalaria glabrata]